MHDLYRRNKMILYVNSRAQLASLCNCIKKQLSYFGIDLRKKNNVMFFRRTKFKIACGVREISWINVEIIMHFAY